ncbi:hypothetical protein HMPREF9123_0619 [Neisseria bacilliformis ATCC BAA-1200]|uniref:Uncharacterized protein n=1 Tax=Neisseria bacilliformis ATCC BAA-1200 TaxID=888742 RepID=F2BA65_9NEIS|nr:hypothetical protein HMPREF9123_0619 [Neisseria bacilliformis ATCC BAA-1200]
MHISSASPFAVSVKHRREQIRKSAKSGRKTSYRAKPPQTGRTRKKSRLKTLWA